MKTSTQNFDAQTFSPTTKCRVCDGPKLYEIVSLGEQPLANSLTQAVVVDAPRAPLELVQCHSCGTVQLGVDVNAELMFSNYLWVTGTSASTVSHCDWVVQETLARAIKKPASVLEIASNDGTLLSAFKGEGVVPLGVDPAENLAQLATDHGIHTISTYFSNVVAENLVSTFSRFDVVVARNVLSHVPNPGDLVSGITSALSEDGVAVIEFHRADIILEELHYDSIYHEHSIYHSLTSMLRILREGRLKVFDVVATGISGGSWLVFACHDSSEREPTVSVTTALEREAEIAVTDTSAWLDFSERVKSHKAEVLDFISSEVQGSRRIIGFGASARSSTLMNYWFDGSQVPLECIIDSNPLKQSMYSPGLGIPIVSPEEGLRRSPDTILLLAFNFESEIRELLKQAGWKGRLARVLPQSLHTEDFE